MDHFGDPRLVICRPKLRIGLPDFALETDGAVLVGWNAFAVSAVLPPDLVPFHDFTKRQGGYSGHIRLAA